MSGGFFALDVARVVVGFPRLRSAASTARVLLNLIHVSACVPLASVEKMTPFPVPKYEAAHTYFMRAPRKSHTAFPGLALAEPAAQRRI